MTVREILQGAGLQEYVPLFEANHIDAQIAQSLSDGDLREIGVASLGHRRRLLEVFAAPLEDASVVERRDVVILFVDLVGSTELTRALDPEAAYGLMAAFTQMIEREVSAAGGTAERHLGDAVMSIFGAPMARGDEAHRACRVAGRLHLEAAALGARHDVALQVRVGVAYGQAIVRVGPEADISVVGPSVNLAARLGSAAEPGETLISGHIRRACGPVLDLGATRQFELKGFDEPVDAWPLVGTLDAQSVTAVGRRSETRFFQTVLADMRDSGRGRMVILRGEAGIGKSCLLERWLEMAAGEGVETYLAQVQDFGGTPAQAILSALIVKLLPDTQLPEGQRVWLDALAGHALDDEASALVAAAGPAQRMRNEAEALGALLRGYSAGRALLVAIEDMHWADAAVRDIVTRCREAAEASPLVVVVTTRIEGDFASDMGRNGAASPDIWTLDLGPLSPEDCRQVAIAIRGSEADCEDAIARSRGHPLYLEQLLRHSLEDRERTLPHSIHTIIQARTDLLSLHDRRAARAAAVLGQSMSLEALQALLDEPDYAPRALIERRILRQASEGLEFHHALIRQSVYGTILADERKEFHMAAARWYRARDLAMAAEHLAAVNAPEAAETYLAAAEDAAQRRHHAEAARIARAGMATADGEMSVALTLIEARAMYELNRPEAAIELYEVAAGQAEAGSATQLAAQIGMVIAMRLVDRVDEAGAVLDDAEAAARAGKAVEALSQVLYLRGSLLFPTGDFAASLEAHDEAYALAEKSGNPERMANALSGRGDAFYAQGRMQAARAAFDRCLEICEAEGLARIKAENLFMRGTVRIYALDWDGALGDALASAELAAAVGNARAEVVSRLTASWVYAWTGRAAEAVEEATVGLAIVDATKALRFKPFLTEALGHAHLVAGDSALALELLEQAVADVRAVGAERFIGPWVMGSLALALGPGDRQAALQAEAEALLERGAVGHNYLQYRRLAIDAAMMANDGAAAARHADALAAYTKAEPSPWSMHEVARARRFEAEGVG